MHHLTRSRRRGIYFKGYVFEPLVKLAEELGLSVSGIVNCACEFFLSEKLTGELKEQFKVEAEMCRLREEEHVLRRDLALILRSGAYLDDYARRLLEGDEKEVSKLKSRKGVYANLDAKELGVILRVLARREAISKRLVELLDKKLPEERYPFGLTEEGFRIKRKGGEPSV